MQLGVRTLPALMLLGVLLGSSHHHATARAEDRCAVCTLAHTSADTTPIVAVPAAVTRPLERAFIALLVAPRFESHTGVSSRAPPLG
jgi:hypothetical protein